VTDRDPSSQGGRGAGPPYPVYVRKYPLTWWLRPGPFLRFAAREITSMFAAMFSVLMLLFLFALSRGPERYEGFLQWLKLPAVIAVSSIILAALLYHMGTWFRLTTHILEVRLGGRALPRHVVLAGLVGVWLAVSAAVAYFNVWFWR
jgi:fumarate reductase subunit C